VRAAFCRASRYTIGQDLVDVSRFHESTPERIDETVTVHFLKGMET
jgi:hypothetical protein